MIVFDNYEIISFDSQLHHLINIGLSHLPVGFKTLFLSRKPLPQAFARHKVSFDMQSISSRHQSRPRYASNSPDLRLL